MTARRKAPGDMEVWEALREVAKRGLGDPSQLTDLDGLLSLDSVVHRATSQDVLGRAKAFVEILTELLVDVSRNALPRRRELLSCLFRFDSDAWHGVGITRRREFLANVQYGMDTSAFRRDEENPLYKELAAPLLDGYGTSPSGLENAVTPSLNYYNRIERLANYSWLCSHFINAALTEPHPDVSVTKGSLHYFCIMQTELDDMRIGDEQEWSRLVGLFASPQIFREFRDALVPPEGAHDESYPFTSQELARLRYQTRLTGHEYTVFFETLDETPRGRDLYRQWNEWLGICACGDDPSRSCPIHNFLALCDVLKVTGQKRTNVGD